MGKPPWNKGLRKDSALPLLSSDDPIYADFKKYRNRVSVRTRRNYRLFKDDINPMNHPLGRCGVEGAYHVDHILSVREGFERRIPVEVISAKENLAMLPWRENVLKYGGTVTRRGMNDAETNKDKMKSVQQTK